MTRETPASEQTPEEPDGTVPPDETEVDPGAGSPAPERDKEQDVPTSDDDHLPAPTPGM